MIGLGIGVSRLRRRGGGAFDFNSIPDLGVCLLPGQGYTEVSGDLDVWNSQYVDTYAEAFTGSMRPELQTDSGTGLLVPKFDGLDDRLMLKNSDGTPYSAGVGTTFYLIRSDGFKTHGSNKQNLFFSDYNNNGIGLLGSYDKFRDNTTIFTSYGSPTFRNNKSAITYVDRGDVADRLYKTDLRLSTEISGDISAWDEPQIGGYRDEVDGSLMYQGLSFVFLHYKRVLTASEISTVQDEIEKLTGTTLNQP